MQELWPLFSGERKETGLVIWRGLVKPRAQVYEVGILWWPGALDRPYVIVLNPPIVPIKNGIYEQIPHLMFNPDRPDRSGLCLFDPDGSEWSPADLIAETTVQWTCEWLHYYELWHLTGEWLGPSVEYESVAQIRGAEAQSVYRALEDVHESKG